MRAARKSKYTPRKSSFGCYGALWLTLAAAPVWASDPDTDQGRPWKPGQSGNPTGRARPGPDELEVRELARRHSRRAIERLAELMESSNDKAAATACDRILDRAIGRAPQALELRKTFDPKEIESIDEILRKIEQLRRGGETIEGEAVPAADVPCGPLRLLPGKSNGSG